MNELLSDSTLNQHSAKEAALDVVSHMDSNSILILCGLFCLTTIICVGCVSFSGSEMTLSKNGLSIKQPQTSS